MILRLSFKLLVFAGFLCTSPVKAVEASFALGQYDPSEGIVSDLYKNNGPAAKFRLALACDDGLAWSSHLFYKSFESRMATLENKVLLLALSSGFRKSFFKKDRVRPFGIEPFFGAGIGLASMEQIPKDGADAKSYSRKTTYGNASTWEVGMLVTNLGTPHLDLELALTDLFIARQLFGTINIGGRILSIGIQYRFGSDESH